MGRRLKWLMVVPLLLLWAVTGTSAGAQTKPNIVLVLTDDQEVALVDHMPRVRALIVSQGTTFRSAYYNDPLCCPSRATILTGKYAHNTGVISNSHTVFHNSGLANRTFAVWLRDVGYRTALIGKYLNGYPNPAPDTYVPPGWSYWAGRIGPLNESYNYTLNENGRLVRYGTDPANYVTDVYRRKAVDFIRATPAGVPLFLELAVHAPHAPSTPAPRHRNVLSTVRAPRPPSFNEADVSDKPLYVRQRSPFSSSIIASIDAQYRQRARSLRAVDEAVGEIVDTLRSTGRLSNTYLVFTSDNGFVQGPHRVRGIKGPPYEEGIRMPLYVRGPAVAAGSTVPHLVGNVDLAPTFAEWAGVAPPADVDGRSFARLLRPGAPGPEAWRQAYPLTFPIAREGVPAWRGVRTRQYAYFEYETGERELYDLAFDPHQLQNRARSADPALLSALARRTADLAACVGAECWRLEDAPL